MHFYMDQNIFGLCKLLMFHSQSLISIQDYILVSCYSWCKYRVELNLQQGNILCMDFQRIQRCMNKLYKSIKVKKNRKLDQDSNYQNIEYYQVYVFQQYNGCCSRMHHHMDSYKFFRNMLYHLSNHDPLNIH